jgi:hypothetical protein
MVANRNEHKEPITRVARCVISGNGYMSRKTLPSGRLFASYPRIINNTQEKNYE